MTILFNGRYAHVMQVGRAGLSSPGFTFQPAGLHKHSTPGQVGKGHFNSVHEIRGEVKCQLCYCTSLLTSCPCLKKTGMVGAGKQYASFSKICCIQEFSSWTVPFNHAHLTPSSCFCSAEIQCQPADGLGRLHF